MSFELLLKILLFPLILGAILYYGRRGNSPGSISVLQNGSHKTAGEAERLRAEGKETLAEDFITGLPRKRAALKNTQHPSHDVHECIDLTMRETGGDWGALSQIERDFLRAYEFDSRILNGGLEDFFWEVSSPSAWRETREALASVGATDWIPIFDKMISQDGAALQRHITEQNEDFLPLSEDYGQQFWDSRRGSSFEEKMVYMENLLDSYTREHYPWI